MEDQTPKRVALSDVTNTSIAPVDEAERKRLERNRKQREYRARKRAEESSEQREERNKKRRDQRLLKRIGTSTTTVTANNGEQATSEPCTSVLQTSNAKDKENVCPDDNMDWLHTNHNYVRTRQQAYDDSCVTNNMSIHTLFNSTVATPVCNSNMQKAFAERVRCSNMDENSREKMLQTRRDYKKKMRAQTIGVLEKETVHVQLAHPQTISKGETEIEYDSNLFEPTNTEQAGGEHLEAPVLLNGDDHIDEAGQTMQYAGDDCLLNESGDARHNFDEGVETMQYVGEDNSFESYRVSVNGAQQTEADRDPYDVIYQNLPDRHVLRKVPDCLYCGAMRFQYEPPGFCCRKGKVHVHVPQVPPELKRLFTSQVDNDAKYFRQNIRYFNSHFSFTSLGVTLDRRVATAAGTGVYTFRVQGALYHRLDHLVPGSQGPRHLQLYFYDTDETLAHRVKRSPDLDINLIRTMLRILEGNPYVETFNRVGAIPNLDDYVIELNTNITPDQRRYNAPTASQVAAIWMDGNDPQRCFGRSVLVYARGDRPRYIRAYHGCYDPLSYPLFYPRGETGWNKYMPYNDGSSMEPVNPNIACEISEIAADTVVDPTEEIDHAGDSSIYNVNIQCPSSEIPGDTVVAPMEEIDHAENDADNQQGETTDGLVEEERQNGRFVTAREYYCFLMQVRKGLFNILLFGGRLFQQWAVDMYIKIESMRLDWYSNPAHHWSIQKWHTEISLCISFPLPEKQPVFFPFCKNVFIC